MNTNELDKLSRDEILMIWQCAKDNLALAKEHEMEMRKYVVSRAFPVPEEGTNTLELGNGYQLKANVKFNYNLLDNKTVEDTLDRIARIGNQGVFIAERLVSWQPSFLLTEFRKLEKEADDGSNEAKLILKECHKMLEIKDAAPTLAIKEPKAKK